MLCRSSVRLAAASAIAAAAAAASCGAAPTPRDAFVNAADRRSCGRKTDRTFSTAQIDRDRNARTGSMTTLRIQERSAVAVMADERFSTVQCVLVLAYVSHRY